MPVGREYHQQETSLEGVCNRRRQLPTLAMLLVGIFSCAFTAVAAQEPYDIDLKELRRPPSRRAKEQQSPRGTREPVSAVAATKERSSSYTVRPGDHLFLILMQRYGLSNEAAERLIPEIMRLNGIRKAESLSVGQRLTIPLPAVTDKPIQSNSQSSSKPPQPESETVPPDINDTPHVRELVAIPARPCLLAREVAEQLGVNVAPFSPFMDAEGLRMSYDTLKVAVLWSLAPAEAYTLERLLALQGVKLLLFKGDEAPQTVIEGVAGALGIPFSLTNADTTAELPLTYLFPAAITGKNLRLTILPSAPLPK
ncbi:MAG: LysM domain-containing protein [Desulfuromonadaceae bacterium]|nr:LysM domain-containing protein [Desulfuromonadaceae bacterium]